PRFLHAAVVYESSVAAMNRRIREEGLAHPRIVALYPEDGTFLNDNPYAIVRRDYVTDDHVAAARAFREDLFYRINVFPVYVPPLRERINDIPGLVDHFIAKFNKNNIKKIKRISSSAIDMLMVYHWPGNIRELENCIERACILSSEGVIRAHNLPPTLQTATSSKTKSIGTLEAILERVEKQMILETLQSTKGNILKASELLGITERILGLRIKKYEIDPKRFKNSYITNGSV
ncbi:MAG: sigma-54-dependent Fis family transcriptional regulator, partial [Bacteroidetes bacterium]|nr:sigma-54-dependent Fis family transcriptional regulator [Bacteroidota bacterium]